MAIHRSARTPVSPTARSFPRSAAALLAVTLSASLSSGCYTRRSRRPPPPPPMGMPAQPPQLPGAPRMAPAIAHLVTVSWLPPQVSRWHALLAEASRRHGVDANLLAIVVLVESGGDPSAKSPAGATGLMQVMPATGEDIAKRRKISGHTEARLLDPAYNIDLGAWYLSKQIRSFWAADGQRTVELAAAAYNGGPGRLRRHLNGGDALPQETRSYQKWVGGMWRERLQPQSGTFLAWYQAGGGRLVTAAR